MTVHVHIDRLVLDGLALSAHAGPALSVAVEAELTRLIESAGLPLTNGLSVPRVAAPGITLDSGAAPGAVGTQVAGSLFSSLSQRADGPVPPGGKGP